MACRGVGVVAGLDCGWLREREERRAREPANGRGAEEDDGRGMNEDAGKEASSIRGPRDGWAEVLNDFGIKTLMAFVSFPGLRELFRNS